MKKIKPKRTVRQKQIIRDVRKLILEDKQENQPDNPLTDEEKHKIKGKWMHIWCDEYHRHHKGCLVEIKELNEND